MDSDNRPGVESDRPQSGDTFESVRGPVAVVGYMRPAGRETAGLTRAVQPVEGEAPASVSAEPFFSNEGAIREAEERDRQRGRRSPLLVLAGTVGSLVAVALLASSPGRLPAAAATPGPIQAIDAASLIIADPSGEAVAVSTIAPLTPTDPQTPRPTPAVTPKRRAPAPTPRRTAAALFVRFDASGTYTVLRHTLFKAVVVTLPGATCSLSAPSHGQTASKTAGSSGVLSWQWGRDSNGKWWPNGSVTITAGCSLGTRTASATRTVKIVAELPS